MAIVKGVNEIVHLPLYDCLFVRPGKQFKDLVSSNILKFFVNIQGKTKLETNMQSSALLPHWNRFEARALRVVISDLPEMNSGASNGCNGTIGSGHERRNEFSFLLKDIQLLFEERRHKLKHEQITAARKSLNAFHHAIDQANSISKDYEECLGLLRSFCDQFRMAQTLKMLSDLRSIRDDLTTILTRTRVKVKKPEAVKRFVAELEKLELTEDERFLTPKLDRAIECLDDFVRLTDLAGRLKGQNPEAIDACVVAAETLVTAAGDASRPASGLRGRFETVARELERCRSLARHGVGGEILGKLLYNSVTTLFVGEKIMIQMPTWFFPAGAGPYSEDGQVVTNGFPTPQATFNFAEPVTIDTQQHFRVEVEIPESDVFTELQCINGPFFIWVVLDGYMTRDVQ